MSNLTELFKDKSKNIKTGEVTGYDGTGFYTVKTEGREIKIKSLAAGPLTPGTKVVFVDSPEGKKIIVKDKASSRKHQEVIIDG